MQRRKDKDPKGYSIDKTNRWNKIGLPIIKKEGYWGIN